MSDRATEIAALIPSGLDPKLTHGLALWFEGHSIHSAAKIAGCAKSTLHQRIQAMPQQDKDGRAKLVEEAIKLHSAISQEAGRQLLERIVNEGDTLKTAELNFAYGTASDKVVNSYRVLQGGEGGERNPLQALLGQLGPGGGKVTMSVEPNAVIDVTYREGE